MLSCQDRSFAGGQRYDFSASTPVDCSVDVSTATLVSLWDARPLDNAARQHEPPRRGKSCNMPGSHGLGHRPTWPDQLSPQLQRNKQLQDTLMQREEELARLQEENNKLKEFLNSSYVKSLEEKTKKLLSNCKVPDGSRHRKRTHRDFWNLSQLLHNGEGKRTCRNLSLEFCSAEELAATPPLDSWILETLGLQDENTIDPERSLVSSPSAMTTAQHFTPPRAASTPYCPQDVSPGPYYNTPACGSSSSPGGDSQLFSTPRMSRSRTDLAFSMSLSPQNSVKTHSFPQGQAFTRRDAQGGWNFTWVPKQCS
uniref:Geminin coiled-coil domain-containing protein 1-like n=1 Tax=Sinocyclocheilus rhinocerous TaxID=307959 RepID=A0A673ITM7_9TELE